MPLITEMKDWGTRNVKPLKVGLGAGVVACVAAAAWKTAPLWVPALVASGPIGWGIAAGIGVALVVALVVLGIKGNSVNAEAPKITNSKRSSQGQISPSLRSQKLWKKDKKTEDKKGGRPERSIQEMIELAQRYERRYTPNEEGKYNYNMDCINEEDQAVLMEFKRHVIDMKNRGKTLPVGYKEFYDQFCMIGNEELRVEAEQKATIAKEKPARQEG